MCHKMYNNFLSLCFLIFMLSCTNSRDIDWTKEGYPRSCRGYPGDNGKTIDILYILPKDSPEPFPVACYLKDGNWNIVLNRFNGSQGFDREFPFYKYGFGSLLGEFWLGLDNIHYMTRSQINEVWFELTSFSGETVHAYYEYFAIGGEGEGYVLTLVDGYHGDAGDALNQSARFSVNEEDFECFGCAEKYRSGWWHPRSEGLANPTGVYIRPPPTSDLNLVEIYGTPAPVTYNDWGIYWKPFRGMEYLQSVKMMMRPRQGE